VYGEISTGGEKIIEGSRSLVVGIAKGNGKGRDFVFVLSFGRGEEREGW